MNCKGTSHIIPETQSYAIFPLKCPLLFVNRLKELQFAEGPVTQ